jgi:hypothetical protein
MDFNGGSLDMLVTSLTIGLGKGGSTPPRPMQR